VVRLGGHSGWAYTASGPLGSRHDIKKGRREFGVAAHQERGAWRQCAMVSDGSEGWEATPSGP
jgi:hypothetical protein